MLKCVCKSEQPFPHILQGRSKLFEGGVAKVYTPHVISKGVGGMLPQKNFVKLGIRSSEIVSEAILSLKSLQLLANRIAIHTLCEVITDCYIT